MQALFRFAAVAGLLLGVAGLFLGQIPAPLPASDETYACPMDPDVRGHDPGTCPRCGMKLVKGIPDPVEYTMDLKVTPAAPKPLQPARFQFVVRDPWKERPVVNFQLVHEMLFHMFVVSQDMKFFLHDHPIFEKDGIFHYDLALPQPFRNRTLDMFVHVEFKAHGNSPLFLSFATSFDWPAAARIASDSRRSRAIASSSSDW